MAQIHYPEMLWPTKERRDRRKASGGKMKAQKARGTAAPYARFTNLPTCLTT
jgi:hypothetical protein